MSLTFVSIEKAYLVCMHAPYEVSVPYASKVIANGKVDNRQTNKEANRHTIRTKTI